MSLRFLLQGSLYSFLLVDLKGHTSLHARSHRLAWVQHNIPVSITNDSGPLEGGSPAAQGCVAGLPICTAASERIPWV